MRQLAGFVEMFWPFLVLIAVFYFFMYRPQKKQEKERAEFLQALKKGDRVVTAGGIHGTIKVLHESTVSLEIAPKVVIRLERESIMRGESASVKQDDEGPKEKPSETAEEAAAEETVREDKA